MAHFYKDLPKPFFRVISLSRPYFLKKSSTSLPLASSDKLPIKTFAILKKLFHQKIFLSKMSENSVSVSLVLKFSNKKSDKGARRKRMKRGFKAPMRRTNDDSLKYIFIFIFFKRFCTFLLIFMLSYFRQTKKHKLTLRKSLIPTIRSSYARQMKKLSKFRNLFCIVPMQT